MFAFVFSLSFKSVVTFNYLVNKAEIIEQFCENKEKPQLQCNGKCHLAKQIVQVEPDLPVNPFSVNHLLNIDFEIFTDIKEVKDVNVYFNTTSLNWFFIPEKINTIFYDTSTPPPKC